MLSVKFFVIFALAIRWETENRLSNKSRGTKRNFSEIHDSDKAIDQCLDEKDKNITIQKAGHN